MPAEAEGEIAAIFARLQDEVRGSPQAAGAPTPGPAASRAPLPARAQAERGWAVTAERPFEHMPTRSGRARGYVLAPVKRVLRKLMRWYVEPLAGHQRTFNRSILTLVDELTARTDEDVMRLERRLEALERRVAPNPDEPAG